MTSVREMVAEAKGRIRNLSMEQLEAARRQGTAVLIDIRDVRERWREGTIPGARHVPRGCSSSGLIPSRSTTKTS